MNFHKEMRATCYTKYYNMLLNPKANQLVSDCVFGDDELMFSNQRNNLRNKDDGRRSSKRSRKGVSTGDVAKVAIGRRRNDPT